MLFKNIVYFIAEAFRGLFKNGWMSVASIGVVAITLLIFGIFVLLNINVEHWAGTLRDQIEIVLFIDDDATEATRRDLRIYLDNHEAIKDIGFVSKEEALEDLKDTIGPESMAGIENPLRDSYVIGVWDPQTVLSLVEELEGLPATGEVICHQEIVETLTRFTRAMRIAALTLMVLLAITATFLISHSIRMTVMLRSKEIMIMKYVGAKDSFIRMPFLFEGLLLGFIGTLVPLICIYYGYLSLLNIVGLELAFLPMVPFNEAIGESIRLIVPMGIGLGVVGSLVSIGRYLKV